MDGPQGAAGRVLREARQRAGLTQSELAERANLTQSVISAYESGRRQPAVPTLMALIEATGLELELSLLQPQPHSHPLTGPIGQIVQQRRRQLSEVAEAHGVRRVRIFGSVARGEDRPDSDLDVLVDLPPGIGLFGFGRLLDDLEAVLGGIRVDLVPAQDLKPGIRERVEREAIPL